MACLFATLASGLNPPRASATSHLWSGGDPFSSNWSQILNWDVFQGVPPNNGTADIVFGITSATPFQFNPTVNVPWSVGIITFSAPYTYILGGSPLTIRGIEQLGPNPAGINNSIFLGADQEWIVQGSSLTVNGAVSLDIRSLHAYTSGGNLGITGVISGSGSLLKSGTGILTLTGANTYSGGTTISQGTLRTGANQVIPAGTLVMRGGTLDLTGYTETVGPGAAVATGLLFENGVIFISPSVIRVGTQLAISTLGTFIHRTGAQGLFEATITDGPLTLGTASATREIRVEAPTSGNPVGLTIESSIINPGGNVGAAPAILKTGGGRLTLSGANTFARRVHVQEGRVRLADGGALGAGGSTNDGTQVSAGATLELSGGITVADEHLQLDGIGLAGNGALWSSSGVNRWDGPVTLASPARIGVTSGTLYLGGILSGAVVGNSLQKVGVGTLVLEEANTYFGPTQISSGTLRVANASGSATSDGTVSVAAGATLAGSGSVAGAVEVLGLGRLAPGTSTGILATGQLTLDPSSITRMEIGGLSPGAGHDQVQCAGPVVFGGTLELTLVNGFVPALDDEFVLLTYGSCTGTFTNLDLPALPSGLYWNLEYGPTSMRARAGDTVGADDALPRHHALHAPAPNPSRGASTIAYDVAEGATVSIHAYDVGGREVARPVEPVWTPSGRHTVAWDGSDRSGKPLAAGTYYLRLVVNGRAIGEARVIQRLR